MKPNQSSQRGVMLLEALVAMLIFAVGVLAIVGLQAASIKSTSAAKYRTDASYLANDIVGQMWVDTPNLLSYKTGTANVKRDAWLNNKVKQTLPAGDATIDVVGTVVTVTITWTPASDSQHRFSTVAQIVGI